MHDPWGRTIDYLRISVTDRCNLRCRYCMPERGVPLIPQENLLTFEEITEVARSAISLGAKKIRLTGGEPLVRAHVVELVGMLARIPGMTDLSMTTNGTMLEALASPLAEAGLQRLNISLDAIDAARYRAKSRGGNVQHVLTGIRAAQAAGFKCIKLNCVIESSCNEPDAQNVADFAREHGLIVRFIRRMNLATGEFWPVIGGAGGDCPRCSRLRLSSDGVVRPCLFSDEGFSVREFGATDALMRAIDHKPWAGQRNLTTTFSLMGG